MPCPRLAPPIIGLVMMLAAPALAQAPPSPQAEPTSPPVAGPAVPSLLQPGDAFGEEVTLPARTVVYVTGHSAWDSAFDTLAAAYKSLTQSLDKQGIKPSGPPMTIYTDTDDTGFGFQAALPVAEAPKALPGDLKVGQAPSGKALKFVHRGSYDAMDSTYEAITNYLDEKQMEAKDQFIEEYVTDILKTSPDHLVVNIYVPVK